MSSLSSSIMIRDIKLKQPTRVVGWLTSLAIVVAFGSAFFQLQKHIHFYAIDITHFRDKIGVTSIGDMIKSPRKITEETLQSYQCQLQGSSTVILSTDPLVIHIHNFVTPFEAKHLITLAEERFAPSTIGPDDARKFVKEQRNSLGALLPDVLSKSNATDPVISCILQKATSFQGHVPITHTEPLQVIKYNAGGFYNTHVDPFPDNDPAVDGNRDTSFFVILKSEGILGTGQGGTSFVNLRRRPGHESGLCEVVECGDEAKGLTWRPVEGSAVFWKNLHENRSIHYGTVHRAVKLPESGQAVKIGMNIWTWNKPYGFGP